MEEIKMHREFESRKRKSSAGFFGIILVVVGAALIANQFDLIPYNLRNVLFTWQAFLILLGVVFITARDSRVTGYILMGVGGFFIIPEIVDVSWEYRRLFWPTLFIILGLLIIFKGGTIFRSRTYSGTSSDVIDDVNVFGGSDKNITSNNFQGGSIVSVFGGGKYDLRQAEISPKGCELEVVNVFGGSNLLIPPDWNVKTEVVGIFGGFSDKRSTTEPNPEKTIIIKGVAIFGGGDIKNI
jgi:predicted membrane protein